MEVFNKLRQIFVKGNAATKLIFINLLVFILLKTIEIIFLLFGINGVAFDHFLALPSSPTILLHNFWSIITYMFFHQDIMHIAFNMLALFWFGKIFLYFFSEKQLVGLYLLGGITGGIFFLVSFNLFPFFSPLIQNSWLLGASGSIMAIIVASAMRSPDMQLQMFLIGSVKLKYIALASVLMSFFGITSANGGGQLAHLGGALTGYLFVVSLRQGRDISSIFNKIIDPIANLFQRPKMRVKKNKSHFERKMTDAEYNVNKAQRMAEIDRILDKIKTSGYESLSAQEKKQLFDQSNKK